MTVAPVGLRCPDHSGKPQGVKRVTTGARRASYAGTGLVTKVLIGLNVGAFLIGLAQGSTLSQPAGSIYDEGALHGVLVADGEWWRLITSAFLHYGIIHLGMNMLALWWFGQALEAALGAARYVMLYLVSGLAGSAGALLLAPDRFTLGASGAIFGIMGAAVVLEQQRIYVFGGGALGVVILNLAFTFFIPNISIGGHLGGLAGGALSMLALSRFGRTHGLYGRAGLLGMAGVAAVGVLSVVISYLQVQQFT
jgi:membrane associated rhomboid family serine protease